MSCHPCDCLDLEQLVVVFEPTDETALPFLKFESQIKLGCSGVDVQKFHGQPWHLHGWKGIVLEDERHLEQG